MNDGEELFLEQDSWNGRSWRVDKSFDELNQKGIDHNVVIIAVHSAKRFKGRFFDDTRRYIELFPKEAINYFDEGQKKRIYSSLSNSNYPKFLVTEVLPFLEEKFQVTLNKNNLGVIGSSMGGISALNTIMEYPDIFGFAGCVSTHWVGIKPSEYLLLPIRKKIDGDKETTEAIKRYIKANLSKIKDHKIYFDHGTVGLDYLYRNPQNDINEIFAENEMTFESKVFKGHDHDPVDFGKRFIPSLNYLIK
jgi:enterochelin esterase-like enzyme